MKNDYMLKGYISRNSDDTPKILNHEIWIKSPKGLCATVSSGGVVTKIDETAYDKVKSGGVRNSEYFMDLQEAVEVLNQHEFEMSLKKGSSYNPRTYTLESRLSLGIQKLVEDLDKGLLHDKFLDEFYTCCFKVEELNTGRIPFSTSSVNNKVMSLGFLVEFEHYIYLTEGLYAKHSPNVTIMDSEFVGDQRFSSFEELNDAINKTTFLIRQAEPVKVEENMFEDNQVLEMDLIFDNIIE